MTRLKIFILSVLACLLCLSPAGVRAEDADFDLSSFAALPMLDQGRIKPLESFARTYLEQLSGRETFEGQSAVFWLARTVFDPASATEDRVFKITRPAAFDLPPHPGGRYDLMDVAGVIAARKDTIEELSRQPPTRLTPDQSALLTLHDNALIYTQLLRSFSSSLPLNIDLPPVLKKSWKIEAGTVFTLDDLTPHLPDLKKRVQRLIRAKGTRLQTYTPDEQALAAFAYQIQILEQAGSENGFLKIIPPESGEEWVSPWMAQRLKAAPDMRARFARMARAWQDGDIVAWKTETQAVYGSARVHPGVSAPRLTAERAYHRLSPFGTAMVLYLGAFLFFMAHRLYPSRSLLCRTAWGALIGAALVHTAGLVLRIYILMRPPVGTLYESVLFVSLIGVAVAFALEYRGRDGTGIVAGSIAGGGLLAVATAFAGGDTLAMLPAVLNTHFWLTVHVLCITIGYGFCLMTGTMAHHHLLRRFWRPLTPEGMKRSADNIKTLALASLLFTAVGTVLGGIWADQSWGRFWGWDPKENGALLITLWLAWALHGRIGGALSRDAFTAAMAFLTVVVALAWFGVNLLGTGLHSYGFIEGVSYALAAFCAVEMVVIGILWHRAARTGGIGA